jgi:hypothetical protein
VKILDLGENDPFQNPGDAPEHSCQVLQSLRGQLDYTPFTKRSPTGGMTALGAQDGFSLILHNVEYVNLNEKIILCLCNFDKL